MRPRTKNERLVMASVDRDAADGTHKVENRNKKLL
jgi:hypothetical protein